MSYEHSAAKNGKAQHGIGQPLKINRPAASASLRRARFRLQPALAKSKGADGTRDGTHTRGMRWHAHNGPGTPPLFSLPVAASHPPREKLCSCRPRTSQKMPCQSSQTTLPDMPSWGGAPTGTHSLSFSSRFRILGLVFRHPPCMFGEGRQRGRAISHTGKGGDEGVGIFASGRDGKGGERHVVAFAEGFVVSALGI